MKQLLTIISSILILIGLLWLTGCSQDKEIKEAIAEMRNSAPGMDGVSLRMVTESHEDVQSLIFNEIRRMWGALSRKWCETSKIGLCVHFTRKRTRPTRTITEGHAFLALFSHLG